jgi:gluconate 2-dehydrogenase gamma chain
MFFNDEEMQLIEAICSRLIPSGPDGPGAREAKVHVYIDRVLAGYFSHLQKYYRQRLIDVNRLSEREFGAEFIRLTPEQQDEMLQKFESAAVGEPPETMQTFFQVILEHTVEGMFGDPMYGGNDAFAGWKLIGFPGAQWGYTREQMQPGYDSRQIEILSVSDLLARRKNGSLGEVNRNER